MTYRCVRQQNQQEWNPIFLGKRFVSLFQKLKSKCRGINSKTPPVQCSGPPSPLPPTPAYPPAPSGPRPRAILHSVHSAGADPNQSALVKRLPFPFFPSLPPSFNIQGFEFPKKHQEKIQQSCQNSFCFVFKQLITTRNCAFFHPIFPCRVPLPHI